MNKQFALAGAAFGAAAALGAAVPAAAHHSFAMFDGDREVVLKGTVKELQWTNPHAFVEVMVRDGTGAATQWSVEGGSVSNLTRQGWSRTSLKPGDEIEITIHPLKRGEHGGALVQVKRADGSILGRRPDGVDTAKR
jgi:hypothetical protein